MIEEDADLAEVDYDRVVTETAKAVLFDFSGDEVWLPLSQIWLDTDSKTVTMPFWLAREKGLI
jgi:hypothetical protein